MKKICAIVVTYNPEPNLLQNIKILKDQVDRVMIVDNASGRNSKETIKACLGDKVFVTWNTHNLGVATALNQGVKYASKNGYEWVITFDQDSQANPGLVDLLISELDKTNHPEKVGIIAPVPYDKSTDYSPRPFRDLKFGHVVAASVITSGSMIRTSVFQIVGQFDDSFFIDYVDHDFCLKLRAEGFELIIVPRARLAHTFGEPKIHHILGFGFFSHNYSPTRRYYMARNRIIAYRRHRKMSSWIAYDLFAAIKDFAKIILVESNKWQKIKAIIMGTFDGLINRLGNLDGSTYQTPKPEKYFVEWRSEIVPLLPELNEYMLDLGCGAAQTSFELKKLNKAKWICGIDGHPQSAEIARTRLDKVLEGDIEKMNFKESIGQTVDTVLALDILEHLVDPWSTVEQIKSVLKPGGVLITSIPNIQHYSTVLPLIFLSDWRYQDEGLLDSTHIRFFTQKTAKSLLTRAGFEIIEVANNGIRPGGLSDIINKLTFGVFANFFIFQIIIKAKKPDIQLQNQQLETDSTLTHSNFSTAIQS